MLNSKTNTQLRTGLTVDVVTAERHLQEFLATAARYVFAAGPVAVLVRETNSHGK